MYPAATEEASAAATGLLRRALARAVAREALHAGDLEPREAAELLRLGAIALVDVRTEPEWVFAGRVPGSARIEWPDTGALDEQLLFVDRLAKFARAARRPLALLCRSGLRSDRAAQLAAHAGLDVYHVLEGFEGRADAQGHRGRIDGWRHAGLPSTRGRRSGA